MQFETDSISRAGCGRPLALLAILMTASTMAFRVAPELDLTVAWLFYDPANGFWLAGQWLWDVVILANKATSFVFAATALVLLPVSVLRHRDGATNAAHYWGLVILLYLMGPGLLVNGLLKRVFGRARPVQITIFGGDGPFTAAWEVSDYCRSGCSFVSTEVSAATALMVGLSIGMLWFARRPIARLFRALSFVALALLLLTAVQRIGSGRHFLSDVVFAALPTAALGISLACLLWPRAKRWAASRFSGSAS